MALLNQFKSKLSSAITEAPEEDVEELAEDDDRGWSVGLFYFTWFVLYGFYYSWISAGKCEWKHKESFTLLRFLLMREDLL